MKDVRERLNVMMSRLPVETFPSKNATANCTSLSSNLLFPSGSRIDPEGQRALRELASGSEDQPRYRYLGEVYRY